MHLRKWLGFSLVLVGLVATSCSKHSAPTAPVSDLGPGANTPENALLRLRWAWANLDVAASRGLFTDDFVFVFGATDSTGNAFRDQPWSRAQELTSNAHLFEAGGAEPPATSITLNFDQVLRKTADPRPGKQNRWHWKIQTSVALTLRSPERSYECQGRSVFYFVRGDSAQIPPDLLALGFRPDSTRWWIERWEDQTVGGGLAPESVLRPLPVRTATWGMLKALYLTPATASH